MTLVGFSYHEFACAIQEENFELIEESALISADGLYLLEVDRVLRPGGYWILSGPPIHWKKHWRGWERTQEDLKQEQGSIEDIAMRLCWKKVAEKGDLAVWQKPINHVRCMESRKLIKTPHICKSDNPDAAWYFFHSIIFFEEKKNHLHKYLYRILFTSSKNYCSYSGNRAWCI